MLIDLLSSPRRGEHRRAVNFYRSLVESGDAVCTTRICEAELRVGLHFSGAAGERAKVEELLSQMIMLELNAAAAEQFGRAKAHLLKIGRPAGDFDTLIAAIALANGQRLITRNPRHFAGLPGLVVETY